MVPQSIRGALVISALLIVFGKASGFLRDLAMAMTYGADASTDVFYIANVVPSLCLTAFYTTIPLSFMPFYIRHFKEHGEDDANDFANAILFLYAAITLAISLATMAAAPHLVSLLAPDLAPPSKVLATHFVRVFSLSFEFSVASAYFSALQYAHDVRLGQQMSPIINNTIFIVAVLALGQHYGIEVAVIAAVGGWVVQLPLQIYFTAKHFRFAPPHLTHTNEIRALAKFSIPVFLATFIEQWITANTAYFASGLGEGSVSVVNYANKLANLPLSLAAILITIYIYPPLIRLAADGNKGAFSEYAARTLKMALLAGVPVVMLCCFEADLIAQLAFGASKLSQTEITSVGRLFSVYIIGVFFLVLRDLISRSLYARAEGYKALAVTVVLVVTTLAFSYWLVPRMGLAGLAYAATLSAAVALVAQIFLMREPIIQKIFAWKFTATLTSAVLVMAGIFAAGHSIAGSDGRTIRILTSILAVLSYAFLVRQELSSGKPLLDEAQN